MISVIIPAYNESHTVAETAERVHSVFQATGMVYELIIVNDGSRDDTSQHAHRSRATVIDHPTNGGYGYALKSGIFAAKYDWIAILDADGTYPIDRFPELLAHIPAFDMVVGARTGAHYWGAWYKRLSRYILIRMVDFVIGEKIPDPNSGMRVFRKAIAMRHFHTISSGFSFTVTLTLVMFLNNHFVKYIPVEYHKRAGKSKVRLGRDALRVLQMLVQAIILYNPLKLYLLLCYLMVAVALLGSLVFALAGALWQAWLVIILGLQLSLLLAGMGFMAESQRSTTLH